MFVFCRLITGNVGTTTTFYCLLCSVRIDMKRNLRLVTRGFQCSHRPCQHWLPIAMTHRNRTVASPTVSHLSSQAGRNMTKKTMSSRGGDWAASTFEAFETVYAWALFSKSAGRRNDGTMTVSSNLHRVVAISSMLHQSEKMTKSQVCSEVPKRYDLSTWHSMLSVAKP